MNWEIFQRIAKLLTDANPIIRKNEENADDTEKSQLIGTKVPLMKLIRKRERLILALFSLVIVSLICSSLKLAEETVQALNIGDCKSIRGLKELQMFARAMRVINSSVNVWIYCISDKRFIGYFFSYFKRTIYFATCKYLCKPKLQNETKRRISKFSSTVTDSQYSQRSRRSAKRQSKNKSAH